jgi:hypothetical protein
LPIRLNIYSYDEHDQYQLTRLNNVHWHPLLPQKELVFEINASGIALILLNNNYRNYFSSKFYEVLALGKFIVYIGPSGKVSDFISINNLGITCITDDDPFDSETFWSKLNVMYGSFKNLPKLYSSHSFEIVSREVFQLLK